VKEGVPVKVRAITVRGLASLPKDVVQAALRAQLAETRQGKRFDEEEFEQAELRLQRTLTDRGYAYARVKRSAAVDLPRHSADLLFEVTPDKPAVWGNVTIQGLGSLPEPAVRRALAIETGKPYSTQEILDAQQAVLDLGVFSSVDVNAKLPEPP